MIKQGFCMVMMALSMASMAQSIEQDTICNKIPEWNFAEKKVEDVYYLTDKSGKVLCDLPFKYIFFKKNHGIGTVKYEDKYYVFSSDGTLLLNEPVEFLDEYDCFFAVRKADWKYAIYDYNGKLLMDNIDKITSNGYDSERSNVFLIQKDDKQYCYSADLNLLPGELREADKEYDFVGNYPEKYYINSSKGLLNTAGEVIIPREYKEEDYSFDDVYFVGIKKEKLYEKVASRFQSRKEYDNLGFIIHKANYKYQLFDMTGRALTPLLEYKKFHKAKVKAATEYIQNYSEEDRNRIYQKCIRPYEEVKRRKNNNALPKYCSVLNGQSCFAYLTNKRDDKIREARLAIAKIEEQERLKKEQEQARIAEEQARDERELAKQQRSTNISCTWTRPPKGSMDSHGWQNFICSFDSQQAIAIKVEFIPQLQKWMAHSQVGKYGINSETHIYVGENDKFWVFSNCAMNFSRTSYTLRPGYDLYIAKDWTIVGLSHEPDVVYDQMVSDRKFCEILRNVKVVGKSPQMLINAQMEAATKIMHEQNKADIQRMIDESNQKIDAINRQSVERYTKRQSNSSSSSTVRGIQYAPDYTGGQYSYWCNECKKWGPLHTHFDLK